MTSSDGRRPLDSNEFALKDGRIFERYSAPMVAPNGTYLGGVWHFKDITTRKRTEAKRDRIEEQLRVSQKEDEKALRVVTKRALTNAGYMVLVATDGNEALKVCAQHLGDIHLLLTDVVMPGMGGIVLARELSKTRSTLDVLYISGYADDALGHHGVLDVGTHALAKPFTAADLTRRVRAVLDAETT